MDFRPKKTAIEIAVESNNLEEVRTLLKSGASANTDVGSSNKLLHRARTPEIARELILHGANINSRNGFGNTPLHESLKHSRFEVLKVLLKHGANVNEQNLYLRTPLNEACIQSSINLKVVKELLEHGADINICVPKHSCMENHITPLQTLKRDEECAKLIIKTILLNNSNIEYKKIFDYDIVEKWTFYEDCMCEIVQMKTEKINIDLPLNKFAYETSISTKMLGASNKFIPEKIRSKYPIYQDIILTNAKLLKKLKELIIYTVSTSPPKVITLNSDCTYHIIQYIPYHHLEDLVTAFYEDVEEPDEDFEDPSDKRTKLSSEEENTTT